MGVPGLIPFLRKKVPEAFVDVTESHLKGRRVGIDLSIVLCKGLAVAFDAGEHFYLEMLWKQVTWLRGLECGIVYVQDGESPPEKFEEKQRRVELRERRLSLLNEARRQFEEHPEDASVQMQLEKLEKGYFDVLPEHRTRASELLEALGVAVLKARGEAEQALAHLQRRGAVDLIFTEDVDVLLCGAESYVKDSFKLMRGEPGATQVVSARVLPGLGMSYRDFVALGVLSGCDFAPKLPRMGPATAFKLLKAKGGLEESLAALPHATDTAKSRHMRAVELLEYVEGAPVLHAYAAGGDEAERSVRGPRKSKERLKQLLDQLGSLALLRLLDREVFEGLADEDGVVAQALRRQSSPHHQPEQGPGQGGEHVHRAQLQDVSALLSDEMEAPANARVDAEGGREGELLLQKPGSYVGSVELQSPREELGAERCKRARVGGVAQEEVSHLPH